MAHIKLHKCRLNFLYKVVLKVYYFLKSEVLVGQTLDVLLFLQKVADPSEYPQFQITTLELNLYFL